jgi:hypothetical protein
MDYTHPQKKQMAFLPRSSGVPLACLALCALMSDSALGTFSSRTSWRAPSGLHGRSGKLAFMLSSLPRAPFGPDVPAVAGAIASALLAHTVLLCLFKSRSGWRFPTGPQVRGYCNCKVDHSITGKDAPNVPSCAKIASTELYGTTASKVRFVPSPKH